MKIKNILIAGSYQSDFYPFLKQLEQYNLRFKSTEIISQEDMNWADTYVGFAPHENFEPSKVKWVHTFNAGVNNYLAISGWDNTLLTRTINDFGEKMSEYCLSYILADLQCHTQFQAQQKAKVWSVKSPASLKDQIITILGTGEIGQKIAEVFSTFGATVNGISNSGQDKAYFNQISNIENAHTILEHSNYIISTLPLTQNTEKLLNQHFFNYLNNAYFINVGRGKVVDTDHLLDALNEGKLRHAVLDVFESEPLTKNSELWQREDVTVTPHISALTDIDDATSCFCNTLKKLENNESVSNQVDFSKGY
ncbi:D-2-hydroxyacid dehydrogenase [Staphylococcus shinii]|uniref:D-2-hydroxyacid dehydrogenase n=1 Tax=Staphylococcus shinii TaxID=2912228 RepID=UPI000852F345|nr:D-2-hydroxyacid dehydrogenase [Staphylococcus shinii]OEK84772.1 phosphoglycerate dehydrogenase [Staphylococcus shinii]QRA15573.1 D-2-hydroxyacid dehydrogenase [Staphylococcus shinii]